MRVDERVRGESGGECTPLAHMVDEMLYNN